MKIAAAPTQQRHHPPKTSEKRTPEKHCPLNSILCEGRKQGSGRLSIASFSSSGWVGGGGKKWSAAIMPLQGGLSWSDRSSGTCFLFEWLSGINAALPPPLTNYSSSGLIIESTMGWTTGRPPSPLPSPLLKGRGRALAGSRVYCMSGTPVNTARRTSCRRSRLILLCHRARASFKSWSVQVPPPNPPPPSSSAGLAADRRRRRAATPLSEWS